MNKKSFSVYALFTCAFICAIIWYAVYKTESVYNLTVHIFDVGQGDGIFMELPNRVQVLIDGGPSSAILSKLGGVMPFWDRTIDMVILTHPHADHVDGLIDVIKRYKVGMILESGSLYATPDYHVWDTLVEQKKIPVVFARKGQRILLSDNAILHILYPEKEIQGKRFSNIHDSMVVSKLLYGSTSLLFMGDAERAIELQLMASRDFLDADILKIGHHGSKTSTTENFLDAVHPTFAVISAGRKNHYGHPHQDVVDRLYAAGVALFRTDINGDIEFTSNGISIWRSK